MTKSKNMASSTPADPIEQDFENALARLQAGKPKNKDLIAAQQAGKLKISVTTVSQEAGHSRTLIGHGKCKYPLFRERVLSCKPRSKSTVNIQDTATQQRREIDNLRKKLALSLSANAQLLIENLKLREDIENNKKARK